MFPPRAVRHVFELLQMRTQSNPPSCTKESQSWISICITLLVFKQSFAFWHTVHGMLAWSLEADSSALCHEGLHRARTNYETIYCEKTHSGQTQPIYCRKDLP